VASKTASQIIFQTFLYLTKSQLISHHINQLQQANPSRKTEAGFKKWLMHYTQIRY
jgi:hypothetical protein